MINRSTQHTGRYNNIYTTYLPTAASARDPNITILTAIFMMFSCPCKPVPPGPRAHPEKPDVLSQYIM